MRVQTEEWRRFIPGIRMYQGKMTYFYNGEILYDNENQEHLIYEWGERMDWEVIIVLPGVEVIPEHTFAGCMNVEIVIMADTVKRIEKGAFLHINYLESVRFSRSLEYIGEGAFRCCEFLTSIFIPPSCREIGHAAFDRCPSLIIFHVPQHTQLGQGMIAETALIKESSFANRYGRYIREAEVNQWLKTINQSEEFALHRACSSFNPTDNIIHAIVRQQGLQSLKKQNNIGITPMQYLKENPYAELEERKIINRYILDMMGEMVV
ncbi:hypothetical protein CTEN210_00847 [Chaetoceros tenuissimus]|uniref:Leucine-rich repeat domain-containing protein n=1 Tax=Chaetoceros tenuissimus TaxID=426638 RepID=A0AAD3GZB9_9STRA|nr:hypothetical protein CTEN210_00847 [Chaetoceros tenuissimus]